MLKYEKLLSVEISTLSPSPLQTWLHIFSEREPCYQILILSVLQHKIYCAQHGIEIWYHSTLVLPCTLQNTKVRNFPESSKGHFVRQCKLTLKELLMMPSVAFYCPTNVHHCHDSRLSIVWKLNFDINHDMSCLISSLLLSLSLSLSLSNSGQNTQLFSDDKACPRP